MSKISGNTPVIPQNIPASPEQSAPVKGGQTPQPVVDKGALDEMGNFPTAGKTVTVEATPEKIVSELNVLVKNIQINGNVIVADKGDIDIALAGKQHLDLSKLDKMYPRVGDFILKKSEEPEIKLRPVFVGLKSVGEALRAGQNSSFPGICNKPTPEGRPFAPSQTVADCVTEGGQALTQEFSIRFEKFTTQNLPQDPMAFIQWVLRESYLETTECLYDYAEKVQFFNDQKKAVRLELEGVRNALTPYAGTAEEDKATTTVSHAV
jgi:hypothetical protein